jgi:ribulose-5-phosphate 4-epimerase/fuculose-1-phosphate aldolase
MNRNTKQTITKAPVLSHEDFCAYCRLLYDRHLVTGVGGNLAVRSGERIFVTPSGYALRDIRPDIVVTLDPGGRVIEGGVPTKDLEMHLHVLRARRDAGAVCHVHGAHIIAVSAILPTGDSSLPPLTPGFVYYAYPLPHLPFLVPGSGNLAKRVAEALSGKKGKAVLLQNHGLVTIGRDFSEAMNVAEEIDEAARVYLLTEGKGTVIPPSDLDKIV